MVQRQTAISQFYQMNRLVVEGGISVCGSVSGRGGTGALTLNRARMRLVMGRL